MENLIKVLLLLLLPFASQGQSLRWFATVQPRDTDTAITLNQLKMPWYSTEDSNKVLGVDENGLVVLRTKGTGGGGSETLQQVISNGNVLTKDDTIVVDGNSFWWEEVDQMYILNGGGEAFRFDAFEGYLYIYGDTVATRPYVRSLIPLQGIANQDDTTQIADFKINGTGQVGDLIVESTIPPTVRLKNTNTTTGDGPFMTMEVTGQNPSSIQYVPKDQTNTLPWRRGARGTGLNMQSPGNLYYVTLGLAGAENADHVFYVNQGAPAYDSLVRFDHNGDVYVYHKPTLGTGDTVLKRRWDGKIEETVVSGGGGGTPAGSTTEVQFNNAGSFGADSRLTYNSTTKKLNVDSVLSVLLVNTDANNSVIGTFWRPNNFGQSYGDYGTAMGFTSGWTVFPGVNTSGRPNVVGDFWGYNMGSGGARVNTNEAAFRFGTESHYETAGLKLFELHLPEFTDSAGVGHRIFSWYIDKTGVQPAAPDLEGSGIGFRKWGDQNTTWASLGDGGQFSYYAAFNRSNMPNLKFGSLAGVHWSSTDYNYEIGFQDSFNVLMGRPNIVGTTNMLDNFNIGDPSGLRSLQVYGLEAIYQSSGSQPALYVNHSNAAQSKLAEFLGASGSVLEVHHTHMVANKPFLFFAEIQKIGADPIYQADGGTFGFKVSGSSGVGWEFRNNDGNLLKFRIDDGTAGVFSNHDMEILALDGGLVLASADGTRYKLTVSNAGALVITAL